MGKPAVPAFAWISFVYLLRRTKGPALSKLTVTAAYSRTSLPTIWKGRRESQLRKVLLIKGTNVYDVMTKTHEINVFFLSLFSSSLHQEFFFYSFSFFQASLRKGRELKKKREVKAKPPLSVSTQKG